MHPREHIIFGGIFSVIVYLIFPTIGVFGFSLIFLSSVFIDLDHAIRYSVKTKNFNPVKFWKWSNEEKLLVGSVKEKRKNKYPSFIFHGIEFLILLFVLSFYFRWAMFVLIGSVFHMFLDYIWIWKKNYPWEIKFSQMWVYIRNIRIGKKKNERI